MRLELKGRYTSMIRLGGGGGWQIEAFLWQHRPVCMLLVQASGLEEEGKRRGEEGSCCRVEEESSMMQDSPFDHGMGTGRGNVKVDISGVAQVPSDACCFPFFYFFCIFRQGWETSGRQETWSKRYRWNRS